MNKQRFNCFTFGGRKKQHSSNENRKIAFTLAEVLITLGIIGVVAAMTLPALIQNYKKHVVETRLMKFYSMINQAIARSEVDNGPREYWDFSASGQDRLAWANKYIIPYVKITKVETTAKGQPIIYFPDGSAIYTPHDLGIGDWVFFTDFKKYNKNMSNWISPDGKAAFAFYFYPNATSSANRYTTRNFEPYKYDWDGNRESLFTKTYKCTSSGGYYCTALIQLNNWKIPDDYPVKF